MRRILAVFAHPDDEVFGPGGTLAKYASTGVDIHLLCATKGEGGQNNIKNQKLKIKNTNKKINIGNMRKKELLKSAEILGIKRVEFMGFRDGQLCNDIYHDLAGKIIKKIKSFRPDIIITFERRGISGHLDHIAVSMITTYAHLRTKIAKKFYYNCLTDEVRKSEGRLDDYFVYFPEGYLDEEITTKIDYSDDWDKKVAAMRAHKSQIKDVKFILSRYKRLPKVDCFILQFYHRVKVRLPELDLFEGI